ncbi:DUF6090 family protein [Aureibaculum sp. 2210JD6-5]|uniref:DUF6090 family protein n=1 Tax=Aureibaculum sp. 2210JD6-5 TaxID=3103957 RepID=UPI002AAD9486|nr:DUF6090 family protein [Aureibaculum sp. 2210JD6-5]MDY7393665.1 DUF6090 family protein [Aureibaculum sp. 2210JD6-5]
MPRFFRSKLPKTITYFLGEILIVVLGIFIAVQLNNWNENNKEQKEVSKALKAVYLDLQTEKYMFTMWKKRLTQSNNYLTQLTTDDAAHLDSLSMYLDSEFYHVKVNSAYINLKSGGNLNLISNDTLKYALTSFYEAGYDALDAFSQSHKAFIYNNVRPYILSELITYKNNGIDTVVVKQKLKDKKLMNLINSQISANQNINNSVLDTSRINYVIELVDKALKNN